MRSSRLLLCALLFVLFCPAPAARAQDQQPIFETGFENPDLFKTWRNEGAGEASLVALPNAVHALTAHLAQTGTHLVSIPLPLDQVRGMRLTLAGKVKAQNVTKPSEPWNGVKLMLYSKSPKGPEYLGLMDLHGSFDWKELGLTVTIPPDATEAAIILGLQDCSGQAWFDDVRLTFSAKPRQRPASQPALLPPEQLDRRSDLNRLRGVMYGPKGKEEDLLKLGEWKANHIRWQFYWYDGSFPEKRLDLKLYEQWLTETMAEVDRFLPLCEKLGIRVVIDLHTPPGATESGQMAIFREEAYQKKFIEIWDRLASHYKDQPAVWGYDLVNEPVEGKVGEGLLDWHSLAELVAKRVRAIDPQKAIIVEPGPHGGWANLPFFEPINVPGLVYSVHMYDPLPFTHQGVLEGSPIGPTYPGMINGVYWDKEKLRQNLEPVRQYQKDYNLPIYIGEFSAIRWAPDDSAHRYLRDCIEIFEEYGWDWSYHAFREWQGWNVELGSKQSDLTPNACSSSREKVLREGFSKNQPRP